MPRNDIFFPTAEIMDVLNLSHAYGEAKHCAYRPIYIYVGKEGVQPKYIN